MNEFMRGFILVFMAEMGDKSQLLALAFAASYPLPLVLTGISLGIILNHGLAILFAVLVSSVFGSLDGVQVFAGLLFLFFGFKSFILDFDEEEEEVKSSKLGPIFTMAGTFFIGELGDKTQLTAMTLALDSSRPWLIFLATVSSMILVSSIGILVGKFLGKKIPEVTMSYIAGGLFLFFGISKLWEMAPLEYRQKPILWGGILLVALVVILILKWNQRKRSDFYTEKILASIDSCKNCSIHNPNCPTALEINRLTQEYIGQDIPFIGDIIKYLEDVKGFDLEKYEKICAKRK